MSLGPEDKEGDLILRDIDDAEKAARFLKEKYRAHVEKGLPADFVAKLRAINKAAFSAPSALERSREPSLDRDPE